MKDLIGFFDSGVGGISVLHTASKLLPNENFFYYGDNGNAPYGIRSLDEIRMLCENAVSVLLEREVKAIVIACNTATSAYAEILRGKLDLPIIGMEPAIKPAQLNRHGGMRKLIFTPHHLLRSETVATQASLKLAKWLTEGVFLDIE